MKMYTRYNSRRVGLAFRKPSLCQPQFARDTDINEIVRRAECGDMSAFMACRGVFFDASGAPDSLHAAMQIRKNAEIAWLSLPDSVRQTYGDVEHFLLAAQKLAIERKSKESAQIAKESEPVKVDSTTTTTSGVTPAAGA